nr:immunoglobulin light chain junction region [Macaca mulatta]
CVQGISFPFAF